MRHPLRPFPPAADLPTLLSLVALALLTALSISRVLGWWGAA